MSIKIDTVIIDSDETSRELVGNFLRKVEDINIVGEFQDAINSYAEIIEMHPNLIIVAPSSSAILKSLLIPIESSFSLYFSLSSLI